MGGSCHVRGGHYGLVMYDSDSARLDDNTITAGAAKDGYDGGFGAGFAPNGGTGLMLLNSDKNDIFGNIFARNAKDGIFIDRKSTDNRVGGNLAADNGKLGINVLGEAIDGGGNRAFGNGWSGQCRGIVCAGK